MKKSILFFIVILFLFLVLQLRTMDTWMVSDIRLDTGDSPGANSSYYPQIACSGNYVYAAWQDDRNGNSDIYFNYSIDNGVNWQPSDIRLDTGDTPGANDSNYPQIAFSGNYVYAVWQDDRNGLPDIYINYSSDNGATWQLSDIRVNHDTSSVAPQIACSGNYIYVVWERGNDIYFNYSNDNGVNWQSFDRKIDVGNPPGVSEFPGIACSGNSVYVVWRDHRNGLPDIYLNYSSDNGATWLLFSDIRLDNSDSPGTHYSSDPQIASYGNNVYVVWRDTLFDDFNNDIFLNKSMDSGVTWGSPVWLDTGDPGGFYNAYAPQIACDGSNVYAIWQDEREGDDTYDIYFNYSTSSGGNWHSDFRLNTDTVGLNNSINPQIACYGSQVYAVWCDNRNGSSDIYFNYSSDNGATWQSSDIRVNQDISSVSPQIACSENYAHVVWKDYRNGSGDIYYNGSVDPKLDIKANGSNGPISITSLDTLQIRISLNSNGLTDNVDYWLAYKGPSGWVHYNNTTKKWETGLGVTHQGPLMDLNNKKVFQSKLSPGNYTFYFGVDMVMNGKVTKSSLYKDEVKVTVTQ